MKFRAVLTALVLLLVICGCHHPYDRYPEEHPLPWTPSDVEMMLGGEDPLEGFNRSMFSCTDFLMCYVADPLGRVYTTIFPRPFIKHFHNVCVNLEYPARAVSSLLQAEWEAAGTETVRFLANTTLGVAGIFDVAQSWFHIPPAEADFGQAFHTWGIGPGHTLIIPIVPSLNGRDLIGLVFDSAFDIKTYIPYAGYATALNRITVAQDAYAPVVDSAIDPYKNYRQLMLVRRELQLRMWFYKEAQKKIAALREAEKAGENGKILPAKPPVIWNPPARPEYLKHGQYFLMPNYFSQDNVTDTMRLSLFQVQRDRDWWYMPLSLFNGDFLRDGRKRSVELVPDRPELRYCFWPVKKSEDEENAANNSPKPEKMVIMLSGIGGIYTNQNMTAIAEQFHNAGYQILTLDSTFNWNFIVADGNCELPGYLPDDAARLRKAIKAVLADLKAREWIKEPEIVICGYSMGGIQTLKLAEMEEKEPVIGVKRFVAINPPVSMETALKKIDSLAASSAGWSKSRMRETLIRVGGNMFLKLMAQYAHAEDKHTAEELQKFRMPISREEAKVVAGLYLKMSLREILLAAHREKPLEGFPEYSWGCRTELYQQFDRVTFEEYAEKLLTPRYPGRTTAELLADSHLKSIENTLRNSPKIRVLHNIDDFLLTDEERKYLDEVLKDRIIWFSNGGHLGNLYYRMVLDKILEAAE